VQLRIGSREFWPRGLWPLPARRRARAA
jgi:hypothetical protein